MRPSTAAVTAHMHRTLAELYTDYAEVSREDATIEPEPRRQQIANLHAEAADLHAELAVKWEQFAVGLATDGVTFRLAEGVEDMEAALWEREVEIERLNDELIADLNEGPVERYDHDHPNDTHCLYLGNGLWACGETDQH